MNEHDLMYASEEDKAFYNKCIQGLASHAGDRGDGFDADGVQIPYSCGAHSLRCFRQAFDYIGKPILILEIGTNLCCSSAMMLELSPKSTIVTCDITKKKETADSVKVMNERYGDRFNYLNRNEKYFLDKVKDKNIQFGLCFVDGGHLIDDVIKDTELCLDLKIPYILYDDFLPQFGDIQEAIKTFGDKLEQIFVNGNIALYQVKI